MKIVTWNVNSIKARAAHVLRFLEREAPDVLMLQELKGLDFPKEFDGAGYHFHSVPQKAYNGVAILSKEPFEVLKESVLEEDEQKRYLEIELGGLRLINIYLPNGNPAPGEKFDYKLRWMDALIRHVKLLRKQSVPFLIGGDFNVIPEARDVYNPASWTEDALFRIETRRKFRTLLNLGLTDAFRAVDQRDHQYSFWDYFQGSFEHDRGLRIDHFLLSPQVTDRLRGCRIDKEPRMEAQPSDHTPVILEIA